MHAVLFAQLFPPTQHSMTEEETERYLVINRIINIMMNVQQENTIESRIQQGDKEKE